MSFHTVLIANRGEIACRVIRSAHALGYRTVAVYSDADAGAPHVALADRAVRLGPGPAADSYLSIPALLAAARAAGADAVHPGYGFLSENAAFAEAAAEAGLVFIGPSAAAIRAMGDKAEAKRLMRAAGVPCIPGYDEADQAPERLRAEAERIGYPLMIKATGGGGGRGMRLVERAADFPEALARARSEALNAFGSDHVLLERAITDGRHVEIQVFGDRHGTVIHLGERDCSVQRRHQKIIEEAPSPAVTPAIREAMGAAAVAAARAIGYVGAGTVEFLLDGEGRHYFLEMNTRLQVEHPVTELVTGLDLVAWQLDIAAGRPLPLTQEAVRLSGHAIEVRLYAEDPGAGFLPATGTVLTWQAPEDPGVRVDAGIRAGQEVTAFYDPMVAKLIVHGRDRAEACRRLLRALERTVLLGFASNRDFLAWVVSHPVFASGGATTRFLDQHMAAYTQPAADPRLVAAGVTLFWQLAAARTDHRTQDLISGGWSSSGATGWPFLFLAGDGGRIAGLVQSDHPARAEVRLDDGPTLAVELLGSTGTAHRLRIDGVAETVEAVLDAEGRLHLQAGRAGLVLEDLRQRPGGGAGASGEGEVRAPMNGRIVDIRIAEGADVERGAVVVVLEAMKMQHELTAARAGRVVRLPVAIGQQVTTREVLAVIDG